VKTDSQFLNIFQCFPEELYRLLGLPDPGPCTVQSVEIKEIARRTDCLCTPQDPAVEQLVVEFQMNRDEGIYDRSVIEAASIRIKNHPRKIRIAIVFGTASLDPQTEPWKQVVQSIYLDEAIASLARREPGHFLVALFRPLLEPENKTVEKLAPSDYSQLREMKHPAAQNASPLADIFYDWLLQRFKTLTATEIAKMIAQLTPIEETAAGRELIGIGVSRGRQEGRQEGRYEGTEATLLKLLARRFSRLPASVTQSVKSLDQTGLEQLTDALLDLQSVEALEAWFQSRK
jgi:predicted transposase YdaD